MTKTHDCTATDRPECAGCSVADCRGQAELEAGHLTGWRLVAASMGLFIGPILLALTGAACLASRPGSQLLGAMTGLLLGIGGSVTVARLIHRFNPRTS